MTFLTRKTMISWGFLNNVLYDLVSAGLIEYKVSNSKSKKKSYFITSKGEEFYDIFQNNEIRDLLGNVKKSRAHLSEL